MSTEKEVVMSNGLPAMNGKKGTYTFAVVIPVVTTVIGAGMAIGINTYGANAAEVAAKIAVVKSLDGQWVFASAFLFSKMIQVLNNVPMKAKDEIMTMTSGNLRSNMFFYKAVNASKDGAIIGLENEGSVGAYNRANRSIGHFVENSLGFVLSFPLVAYVYPKQTFSIMAVFCFGRIAHQFGYTTGYGGHALGFVASLLSSTAIDGLGLFVAGKAFGYL